MPSNAHGLRSALVLLWRTLRRQPLFAISAIGAMALGVGSTTAVFTLVNAILLRPLPIHAPDELVNVHRTRPDGSTFHSFSYAAWSDLRRQTADSVDLAAFTGTAASLRTDERADEISSGNANVANVANAANAANAAELIAVQVVSANYLDMLGVGPALGAGFGPANEGKTGEPVALLGHRIWETRFGGSAHAIGRHIWLNGQPFTVVGVLPEGFAGHFVGFAFDVWVPLHAAAAVLPASDLGKRTDDSFELIGRRRSGTTLEQARARLATAMANIVAANPEQTGDGIEVRRATPLDDSLRNSVRLFLTALLAIAGMVLLIAAVNVAGMLLARAETRRREIALRRALGAGTGTLIRLLLVESIGVCALGGALGLGLAAAASRLFLYFNIAGSLPLVLDLHPDVRVAAFAVAMTLLAALLAALSPVLQARRLDLTTVLREGSATLAAPRGLRRLFVMGQLAMALALIAVAGLFVRAVDRGGRTAAAAPDVIGKLATADILWSTVGKDPAEGARFYQSLLERTAALPDTESASLARRLPFGPERPSAFVARAEDGPPQEDRGRRSETNVVAPGFFATLGWPLLTGRDFLPGDRMGAPQVAIVSDSLARRLWPRGDAMGKQLWLRTGLAAGVLPAASETASSRQVTVVGVARDITFGGASGRATLYLPFAQSFSGRMTLVVRTAGDPSALSRPLAQVTRDLLPDLAAPLVVPMSRALAGALLPQRLAAAIALALGGLGLLLALGGVYAVVAMSFARRRREMAIRMAAGAGPRQLTLLVLRETNVLALGGAGAGLLLAALGGYAVRGFLLGVSAIDPTTLLSAVALLGGAVLLAGLPVALGAAKTDPSRLLRE